MVQLTAMLEGKKFRQYDRSKMCVWLQRREAHMSAAGISHQRIIFWAAVIAAWTPRLFSVSPHPKKRVCLRAIEQTAVFTVFGEPTLSTVKLQVFCMLPAEQKVLTFDNTFQIKVWDIKCIKKIIWWDRSRDMIRDVWSCNHCGLVGTFEQMLADSWCDHKPLWVESDNENSRHCLSDGHQKGPEWLEATGHGWLSVCAASLSLCVDLWLLSINCSDGTDVNSQRLTAFLLSR